MIDRWTGPVRFQFMGDKYAASTLQNVARKELGVLRNLMGFQNLQQDQRTVHLSNGIVVNVQIVFGQARANIFVPVHEPRPEELTWPQPEKMPEIELVEEKKVEELEPKKEAKCNPAHISKRRTSTTLDFRTLFGEDSSYSIPLFEEDDGLPSVGSPELARWRIILTLHADAEPEDPTEPFVAYGYTPSNYPDNKRHTSGTGPEKGTLEWKDASMEESVLKDLPNIGVGTFPKAEVYLQSGIKLCCKYSWSCTDHTFSFLPWWPDSYKNPGAMGKTWAFAFTSGAWIFSDSVLEDGSLSNLPESVTRKCSYSGWEYYNFGITLNGDTSACTLQMGCVTSFDKDGNPEKIVWPSDVSLFPGN